MRIDARPGIRCRFAAIIKARPHKAAAQPRALGEIAPPRFSGLRPGSHIHVVSTDVAAFLVIFINAARADGAGLFGADVGLIGMFGVITVHVPADMIIPAAHVNDAVDAVERVALRRGVSDRARRVKALHQILHRAGDVAALRRGLDDEFFVGHAPECRRWRDCGRGGFVPPTCADFPNRCRAAALVHDDHAEAVTRFEQFRRGRIVRRAIGVVAKLLQLCNAEILERIRQRSADACHVLMIAGAFKNVRLAVQEKSFVLVEGEGADAELGFYWSTTLPSALTVVTSL